MTRKFTRRKYRAIRPSRRERSRIWEFQKTLYSKDQNTLPPKTKKPARRPKPGVVYTDKEGNAKTLALSGVTSYDETDWFSEAGTLFPQIPEDRQATFGKQANAYDEDGRPSLTARNLIIVDVHHMTKGQYGPWYLMHVVAEGDDEFAGEWTIPTRGQVVNEAIEALSGVSLETGKRIAPGELPVALRIEFAAGEGEFEGYFYPTAPVKQAEVEPVEA